MFLYIYNIAFWTPIKKTHSSRGVSFSRLPDDTWHQQYHLIDNEEKRDGVVILTNTTLFLDYNQRVSERGRTPSPTLLEELVERFRTIGAVFRGGTVFKLPSWFNQQCTEPTIFACVQERTEKHAIQKLNKLQFAVDGMREWE